MNRITVRKWLIDNGYDDVLLVIEEIIIEWRMEGKKTRRNWWEYLAGDKDGKPKKINGKELPVLRAAQIREGREVTPNAICRNIDESIEAKWKTNRWPQK